MNNIKPYLAGILDGEGYIGLLKHNKKRKNGDPYYRYVPRLAISFLDKERNREVLNLFKATYGGLIYDKKLYEYNSGAIRKSHNPMICYELWNNDVRILLTDLLPYLIIKKPQAELLLAIKYNPKGSRKALDETEITHRQFICEKIKSLNGNKIGSK